MRKIFLFLIAFTVVNIVWAQKDSQKFSKEDKIDVKQFNDSSFSKLLLKRINQRRIQLSFDSLSFQSILQEAANSQAQFMAKKKHAQLKQGGKKKTTAKRIAYFGGAKYGEELVFAYGLKKGEKIQTYKQAVEDIALKWLKGKKTAAIAENPKYIFAGISAAISDDSKKMYISFVVGNYFSLNEGAALKEKLPVPYSKRRRGLKPYDAKSCSKLKKVKNIEKYQNSLSIQDGKIYFETNNLKAFKKFMKKPKDGLAVDIVQKKQYACSNANITDNSTPWKGIMIKRKWSKKIYKKNEFRKDKKLKKTNLRVVIGKTPKHMPEDVELNLLIIQNRHVCRNIAPSYVDDAALDYASKVDFLPDTISPDGVDAYVPSAESSTLNFRIPFERSKYDYQESDIAPIIKSLKEPDFIINSIQISAYSSIEGSDRTNKKLQEKRAASIENALKSFISVNKGIKQAEVVTAENWEAFKRDVAGTEYANLANMTMEEAKAKIKEERLANKLEDILKNHRYAEVKLQITYDIKGDKEQAYVVSRFNKAVELGDRIKALSIQKYIFKKVLAKEYDKKAVDDEVIPETKAFAGILMNKYWLQKYLNELSMDNGICEKVEALYNLDSENPYLQFNKLFCTISWANLANEKIINDINNKLNVLYKTPLQKKTVDNLNLEYLFGIIEAVDTMPEPSPLALESLEKIKEIVDIKELNMKAALKLAILFVNHNDYQYSAKLLEPFIADKEPLEDLLFTYISLCTHSDARIMSNKFPTAIEKALKINKNRLCELFETGRISPQVFDNLKAKGIVCESCQLKN